MGDINFGRGVVELIGDDSKLKSVMDRATKDVVSKADKMQQQMTNKLRNIGIGLMSIGTGMVAAAKSATMTAARTEVLGVALNAVGKNANMTTQELAALEAEIKSKGITTQEARLSLIKFMQSEIDLAQASDLARTAQDLAVIAANNSSEAFGDLTQAIAAQRPMLLRQYGIVMGIEEIYDKMGKQLGIVKEQIDSTGKTTQSWMRDLTETEKKQAFLNVILEKGAQVAGVYEDSMNAAGKRLTSLPRLIEEMKNSIGEALLPTMLSMIKTLEVILKFITNLPEPVRNAIGLFLGWGGAIMIVSGALTLMTKTALAGFIISIYQSVTATQASIAAMTQWGVYSSIMGGWLDLLKVKAQAAWRAIGGPVGLAIGAGLIALGLIVKGVKEQVDEYDAKMKETVEASLSGYQEMAVGAGQYADAIVEVGRQIETARQLQVKWSTDPFMVEAYAADIQRLEAELQKYLDLAEKVKHFKMFEDAEKEVVNLGYYFKQAKAEVQSNLAAIAAATDKFEPALRKVNEAMVETFGDVLQARKKYLDDEKDAFRQYSRESHTIQSQYETDRMVMIRDAEARIAAMAAAGRDKEAAEERKQLDYNVSVLDGNYKHQQAMLSWNEDVKAVERKIAFAKEMEELRSHLLAKLVIESTADADGLRRMARQFGLEANLTVKQALFERDITKWKLDNSELLKNDAGQYTSALVAFTKTRIDAIFGEIESVSSLQDAYDALYTGQPVNIPEPPPLPTFDTGGAGGGATQTQTAVEALEDTVSKAAQAINAAFDMFDKLISYRRRDYTDKLKMLADDTVEVIIALIHAAWKLGDSWHDIVAGAGEYAEGAGKAVGLVSSTIDALGKLKDYTRASKEAIEQVADDTLIMVKAMVASAQKVDREGLVAAYSFSQAAQSIVGLVKPALEALTAVFEWRRKPLDVQKVELLASQVTMLVEGLRPLGDLDVKPWQSDIEAVTGVVGQVGTLIGAVVEVAEWRYKDVSSGKVRKLILQAKTILDEMVRAFGDIKMPEEFAATVKAVGDSIAPVEDMISAVSQIANWAFKPLSRGKIDKFFLQVKDILGSVWNGFAHLTVGEWDEVKKEVSRKIWGTEFAETLSNIGEAFDAVQTMLETVTALSDWEYKPVSAGKIDKLMTIARDLLRSLWAGFAHLGMVYDKEGKFLRRETWGTEFAETVVNLGKMFEPVKTIVDIATAVAAWEYKPVSVGKIDKLMAIATSLLSSLWRHFAHLGVVYDKDGKAIERQAWGGEFAETINNLGDMFEPIQTFLEVIDAVAAWKPVTVTQKKIDTMMENAVRLLSSVWRNFSHLGIVYDKEGKASRVVWGTEFAETMANLGKMFEPVKTFVEVVTAITEWKPKAGLAEKVESLIASARLILGSVWEGFKHLGLLFDKEGKAVGREVWGTEFAETIANVETVAGSVRTMVETLDKIGTYKPKGSVLVNMEAIISGTQIILSRLQDAFGHLVEMVEGEPQVWGNEFASTVENISRAVGSVGAMLESVDKLSRWRPKTTDSGKAKMLFESVRYLLDELYETFKTLIEADEDKRWDIRLGEVAENFGKGMNAILSVISVSASLDKYKSPPVWVMDAVVNDLKTLMTKLDLAAKELSALVDFELTGEFADIAAKAGAAIQALTNPLSGLTAFTPVPVTTIDAFAENIKELVKRLGEKAEEIDENTMILAGQLSETFTAVGTALSASVGGLKDVFWNTWGSVFEKIPYVVRDMVHAVRVMDSKAKELEAEGVDLERVRQLASMFSEVSSALQAGTAGIKEIWFWRANVDTSANLKNFITTINDIVTTLAGAWDESASKNEFWKATQFASWADVLAGLLKKAFEEVASIKYGEFDWGRYKALGRAIMMGMSEGLEENLGYIQTAFEKVAAFVLSFIADMGYEVGLGFWGGFIQAIEDNLSQLAQVLNVGSFSNMVTTQGTEMGQVFGVGRQQMVSVSVPITIEGPIIGQANVDELVSMISGGVLRLVNDELGRQGLIVRG